MATLTCLYTVFRQDKKAGRLKPENMHALVNCGNLTFMLPGKQIPQVSFTKALKSRYVLYDSRRTIVLQELTLII